MLFSAWLPPLLSHAFFLRCVEENSRLVSNTIINIKMRSHRRNWFIRSPGLWRSRRAPISAVQQPNALAMTARMRHLRLSLEQITYILDEALFNAVNVLARPPELVLEVAESSVSAMVVIFFMRLLFHFFPAPAKTGRAGTRACELSPQPIPATFIPPRGSCNKIKNTRLVNE